MYIHTLPSQLVSPNGGIKIQAADSYQDMLASFIPGGGNIT